MAERTDTQAMANGWRKLSARFDGGPGARWSYGFISLSTDRVCEPDVRAFLPDDEDLEVFGARIPMAPVASTETLTALRDHVTETARQLIPWGRMDAIGFGCTSGAVAIGTERLAEHINAIRPGVPVINPVDGAVAALAALGVKEVALMTPYQAGPNALIEGYFRDRGISPVTRASFFLDGDPDMNRISAECLIEAGAEVGADPKAEALFISCTGLTTNRVVAKLESRLRKPVVTSNQALAWAMMRAAGDTRALTGRGRLFELQAARRAAAE